MEESVKNLYVHGQLYSAQNYTLVTIAASNMEQCWLVENGYAELLAFSALICISQKGYLVKANACCWKNKDESPSGKDMVMVSYHS